MPTTRADEAAGAPRAAGAAALASSPPVEARVGDAAASSAGAAPTAPAEGSSFATSLLSVLPLVGMLAGSDSPSPGAGGGGGAEDAFPPAAVPGAPDPPPIRLGLYMGVDSNAPRTPPPPAAPEEAGSEADDEAMPLSPSGASSSLEEAPLAASAVRESSLGPDYVAPFEPDTAEVYVGVPRAPGGSPRVVTRPRAQAAPAASPFAPGTSPQPAAGVAARGAAAPAASRGAAMVAAAVSAAAAAPPAARAQAVQAVATGAAAERAGAAAGPGTRGVPFTAAREACLEGAWYMWEEPLPQDAPGRGALPGTWGRKPGAEAGAVWSDERYAVITASQRFRSHSVEELRWNDYCDGCYGAGGVGLAAAVAAAAAAAGDGSRGGDSCGAPADAAMTFARPARSVATLAMPAAPGGAPTAGPLFRASAAAAASEAGLPDDPEALRAAALSLASGVSRLADALAAASAENATLTARLAERRFASADVAARLAAATAEAERGAARAAELDAELAAAREAAGEQAAALRRLQGAVAPGASEQDMAAQEAELQANLERLREAVREERLRRSLRSAVQKEFLCPITMTTFCDPVIAADGHSYERSAIEAWLQHHNTSPLTNLQLPHKHLVPNRAIKSAIASIMAAEGGIKPAAAGAAADEGSTQGA